MCISLAARGAGATRASSPCRSELRETGGAALFCNRITTEESEMKGAPAASNTRSLEPVLATVNSGALRLLYADDLPAKAPRTRRVTASSTAVTDQSHRSKGVIDGRRALGDISGAWRSRNRAMGREGFEPSTLGLRVRHNEPQQTAR